LYVQRILDHKLYIDRAEDLVQSVTDVAHTEVRVENKARESVITVRLTSPAALQNVKGHLNVFTDHPSEPVVQIPVAGWGWAHKPFDVIAADGSDARLADLVLAALYHEELISEAEFIPKILGGVRDDRAASLLLRAMSHRNWHWRERAVTMLGHLGNSKAIPQIRQAVTDDVDEDVRRAAAAALVKLAGNEALPVLLLALQDNDDWVREDAAVLLGMLGDQKAVSALKKALNDSEEDVRNAARRALKKLGAEGQVPQVQKQ